MILFVAIGGMVAVAHTDLPNGIIIVSACLLAVPFVIAAPAAGRTPHAVLPPGHFAVFSPDFGKYPALKALSYFLSTLFLLLGVQSMYQKFYAAKSPAEAKKAVAIWIVGTIVVETIVICIAVYASSYNVEHQMHWSGRSLVLNAARYMTPGPVGVLLLAAACAVVLSTGMNYLLSSSSNVIRDIYQKLINPSPTPTKMVGLQKVFIVVMGLCAFLMIFIPTYLKSEISVLQYAYFAYTMYGVAVTPALFAALTWKRATRQGGVASIVGGAVATVFFEVLLPVSRPVGHGRHRRVGHPEHLPGRHHLDRPARRRQPAHAAAEARGTGEAVSRRPRPRPVGAPAPDVVAWRGWSAATPGPLARRGAPRRVRRAARPARRQRGRPAARRRAQLHSVDRVPARARALRHGGRRRAA